MVVTDGGTPTRGTYANVTVELSNSCLVDFFYKPTLYNILVENTTGDVRLTVPGYYYYEYGMLLIMLE